MQQFCTYGSVRGALGNQRPYRDKRPVGDRLPHGRSSVNTYKHALAILSRAREQADFGLFSTQASGEVVFHFIEQALFVRLIFFGKRFPQLLQELTLLARELARDFHVHLNE